MSEIKPSIEVGQRGERIDSARLFTASYELKKLARMGTAPLQVRERISCIRTITWGIACSQAMP